MPLLYPETLEVSIRGRVQLRILELGDEAGEKQQKKSIDLALVWQFKQTLLLMVGKK